MEQGEISGEEGNEETGVGGNEGDRCNISEEELSKNECRGVQGTEEAERQRSETNKKKKKRWEGKMCCVAAAFSPDMMSAKKSCNASWLVLSMA